MTARPMRPISDLRAGQQHDRRLLTGASDRPVGVIDLKTGETAPFSETRGGVPTGLRQRAVLTFRSWWFRRVMCGARVRTGTRSLGEWGPQRRTTTTAETDQGPAAGRNIIAAKVDTRDDWFGAATGSGVNVVARV